ncbi:MAG TPA: hypothetical protein VG097_16385 [Gemmata sp.]|nr:hypothetical protein [Gemmata sp.]
MTQRADFNSDEWVISLACAQTVALLQRVCDNELPSTVLDADPHLSMCSDCRGRMAVAKQVLAALSPSNGALAPRPNLTDKIVEAILADKETRSRTRYRRRVFAFSGGLAVAATVLLAAWYLWPSDADRGDRKADIVRVPLTNSAPMVGSAQTTSPTQPTVRLGDEFYKAEQALLGSSKPITEPASVAPQVFAKLTDVLTRPSEPGPEVEPAGISLLEIPDAARSGLQPVTSTTQKAFARLLHDMGAVQLSAKPN